MQAPRRNQRIRTILWIIIAATIPFYLLGIVLLSISQASTPRTPTITLTATVTRYMPQTPSETLQVSPTASETPTATGTITPTRTITPTFALPPSSTPTVTVTETATATPIPPTDTATPEPLPTITETETLVPTTSP